jgi:integrase
LKEILSTVRTRKYTSLFALLAGTGLRIGEALALRPTDFGPDCRVLHIRRSIWRGQEQQPKTANALRVLDLPEVLAKELRNFVGASMAISSQPRKANHYSDEMSCEFYTA